ncbi:MAG: serine hydrolase [Mycobacterium sp.]
MNAAANIDWAISIRDAAGRELVSCNTDRTMEIASVGKLLLLVEVARQFDEGILAADEMLGRDPTLLVADSGIWQHLHIDNLSIHDLCVLVASVSDNLATNVLLKRIGFQRLSELCRSLGLANTALLDYVRDHRGPNDPVTFSTGSASELSRLMSQLSRKELVSQEVSEHVNAWLAAGVDLSMVASAFGLDPLSHATSGRHFFIRNKTGTDTQIRADVGTVGRDGFWLSYAVIANWDTPEFTTPDTALAGMNAVGKILRGTIDRNSG